MPRLILSVLLAVCLFASSLNAQQKTIVQTAVEAGNFNTLVAAVKAADLVDTLNSHNQFTVFAPTDDAFAKLDPATIQTLLQPENKSQLASILTYHVVQGRVNANDAYDLRSAKTVNGQRLMLDLQGDALKVGDSKIVVTDIQCSNGVIHVIDTVLLPKSDNIPATATAVGQFNTLLAAVNAADLGGVLSGPGPFTVFAPTDDAFAALPAGTVESLLLPENKQKLVDILKYHVVSGRAYDNDAVKAGNVSTLLGRSVNVKVDASGVSVNDAKIVAKNVETTNGVIHVIDSVLIPTAMTRTAAMAALEDAVSRGSVVFNSGDYQECCNIYTGVMNSVLSAGVENSDQQVSNLIQNTLQSARNISSSSDRAWELRRGIDALYGHMNRMSATMSNQIRTSN
jgi:uncharacterized surface protein with fasciclin (FAS1) repeats